MPWGWILSALLVPTGLFLLALALFHVRIRASWGGAWESLDSRQAGSFRVEYGFPGFMRAWEWDEEEPVENHGSATGGSGNPDPSARAPEFSPARRAEPDLVANPSRTAPQAEAPVEGATRRGASTTRPSSKGRSRRPTRNRWRRALFRLATDGKAWRLLARHGYRTARGMLTLLKPRVAIAVGHPDPVLLGRVAACWHAAAPLAGARRATLELRFQDRRPTFAIRVEGGFSALSFVLFGLLNASTFPWIGLGRRAWHSWWRHELDGWRRWAYRSLQG